MTDPTYTVQNIARQMKDRLSQYIEAQYHIWDETLVRDRQRLLNEPGVIAREPYIESTPSYVAGQVYDNLRLPEPVKAALRAATSTVDNDTGIPRIPYLHQAAALEAYFSEGEGQDLVVSTGTGSGKTESFLMPIIGSLALEKANRPASYARPGVRAILIYPMNALVNDQLTRLRRLLGSPGVANALRRSTGHRATFGIYTSRTPYPGQNDLARTQREVGGWIDEFFIKYSAHQDRLMTEGKWPTKDLTAFRASFQTSPDDSELLTRQEMQNRAPDVLVTNYSMLEYMLLRPVDASLFTTTRAWLDADKANKLTLVLDEAHLYQGAQGTEVALLLRRLASRLRVARERIRYIITSASLAAGANAPELIREFASQLTGATSPGNRFAVIQGVLNRPQDCRSATQSEAAAFGALPVDVLLNAATDMPRSAQAIDRLFGSIGIPGNVCTTSLEALKDSLYALIEKSPVARALVDEVMGRPISLSELAQKLFPVAEDSVRSLDALLAVCAYAKRASDSRVFLPSRAHLLFRGLDGIWACINPSCEARGHTGAESLLGQLYARAQKRCSCGARVFELLTHRDCGAAYLRGYAPAVGADFLWHEPDTDIAGLGAGLLEIHLLVEYQRDQLGTGNRVWLHKRTGRLERREPGHLPDFLELREPTVAPVLVRGRNVATFTRRCPVCRGQWRDPGQPKIMDLATKGEDPFAYLISTQVQLQPITTRITAVTPNGGRKALLFSDGRQKAARLARDVPRVIERDAFRQTLLLAAQRLLAIPREARLSDTHIYTAFVAAAAQHNLRFFDAADVAVFREHSATLNRTYRGDLALALSDPWEPSPVKPFRVNLLRTLGSPYYSLCALGLGYVRPRARAADELKVALIGKGLTDEDLYALSIVWIRGMLEDFALYRTETAGRRVRELAAGYPFPSVGSSSGLTAVQQAFLRPAINLGALEASLIQHLTEMGDGPGLRVIAEGSVVLVPSLADIWYRCDACTYLSPVTWRGLCAACGLRRVREVRPGVDEYMRARKSFWRDPVERVLNGTEVPMTIDVEEHTAQLGYRDLGDLEATTESYERRFRDILLAGEEAIDVLSCTTTMEVGIDIGSLIAVGLRNMPPSRHNYQQRAGRAGRRGSAVSTVVTFAQNNPHDADLFDNPAKLIRGSPTVTGLDLGNPVLAVRHAFAELLQEYFDDEVVGRAGGNVFSALGDTVPFFSTTGDGSLVQLSDWLRTAAAAAATLERISGWLPPATGLNGPECADRLIAKLQELRPAVGAVLPRGEDKLIEFLFARGVLPAYAFPRDLVSLQIEHLDARGQVQGIERPQQGSNVALSEYAPGRLVVVNKQTYRIGAVTANTTADTVDRAPRLFVNPGEYIQCPNCLYTAEVAAGGDGTRCPTCAAATLALVTVIQPELVWAEGRGPIDELDDDQTITETTIAQLPVPASDRAFEHREAFGHRSTLSHGRQVPLIMMNRGAPSPAGPTGFMVCDRCGYATVGTQPFPARHERHYHISARRGQPRPPSHCTGPGRSVYLGYQFNTDVLLLRTTLSAPFLHDLSDRLAFGALRDALNSLSNGLALTAAGDLDIDPRELQSGIRLQRIASGESIADLYLYDTLAGGAGYSSLIGRNFAAIFDATCTRLARCTCQSSCSDCLRTYANRMYHHSLDRHLALQLAHFYSRGTAPVLLSDAEQRHHAEPLRDMLGMRGYTVADAPPYALRVASNSGQITVGVVPTLRDRAALPPDWGAVVPLTVREIDRDLPSCLVKLAI
jgi:ATP-dependent helicase YprA (DUF1998 family)